jgi:lipopolysaccharide transport system permease protein
MATEVIIRPKLPWQLVDLKELWAFRELLYIFTWRDIKLRYKQTVIGVLWVVLQPVVNTVIFTVFFGNFAKIPSGSLPYPVFVLLGLVFWGFFSASLSHAASIFIENEQLVKKVYFPRELLPISTIGTAFVDFLVTMLVLLVLLVVYRVTPYWQFFAFLPLAILITVLTTAGLGLLLASVNIKYRDVRYVIPFFLQTLIFVTPVIYPLNIVRPSFQYLLALNPMTGVIDTLRSTLSSGTVTHPEMLALAFVSSVIMFVVGLLYFRSTERFFADII